MADIQSILTSGTSIVEIPDLEKINTTDTKKFYDDLLKKHIEDKDLRKVMIEEENMKKIAFRLEHKLKVYGTNKQIIGESTTIGLRTTTQLVQQLKNQGALRKGVEMQSKTFENAGITEQNGWRTPDIREDGATIGRVSLTIIFRKQ